MSRQLSVGEIALRKITQAIEAMQREESIKRQPYVSHAVVVFSRNSSQEKFNPRYAQFGEGTRSTEVLKAALLALTQPELINPEISYLTAESNYFLVAVAVVGGSHRGIDFKIAEAGLAAFDVTTLKVDEE
jgi:hypothetical protein